MQRSQKLRFFKFILFKNIFSAIRIASLYLLSLGAIKRKGPRFLCTGSVFSIPRPAFVDPRGRLLCIIFSRVKYKYACFILFIPLFVKMDARYQVVAPPVRPAAIAHFCALAPSPFRLRAHLFP